jgi:hypothetical protein
MNKKQIKVEKDATVMQKKKKMFMYIIHCLDFQHCYIHFISTEGEKQIQTNFETTGRAAANIKWNSILLLMRYTKFT